MGFRSLNATRRMTFAIGLTARRIHGQRHRMELTQPCTLGGRKTWGTPFGCAPISFTVRGSLADPRVKLDLKSILKQPAVKNVTKQGEKLLKDVTKQGEKFLKNLFR